VPYKDFGKAYNWTNWHRRSTITACREFW